MISPAVLDELRALAARDVHVACKAVESYERMLASPLASRTRRAHRKAAERRAAKAMLLKEQGRV